MKTKVMHKEYIPLATLILLTIISIVALTPIHTYADNNASADVGINVAVACTLSGNNTSHAITLNNGNYNDNITGTTLHTECNGNGNYKIYAIGYTNNTDGDNVLDGGTSGTIPTGTTLDGKVSNWAMKLANSTGNTATIENGYSGFSIIPSTSTLVASYNASSSNQTTDSTLQTTYGVSISPNQPAGTYTGAVKYNVVYNAAIFSSISGQIRSYNKKNPATVSLYSVDDTSHTMPLYTTILEAPSTAGSAMFTQAFTMTDIASGTYDLVISKVACLDFTVRGITIGSSSVDLTSHANTSISTMRLIQGDVNGDGIVDNIDKEIITSSDNYDRLTINAVNPLTDLNGDGLVELMDKNIATDIYNYNKTPTNSTFDF